MDGPYVTYIRYRKLIMLQAQWNIFKSSWAQAFVLGLDYSPDLNTVNVFAKSKCGLIPIVPRCFARPVQYVLHCRSSFYKKKQSKNRKFYSGISLIICFTLLTFLLRINNVHQSFLTARTLSRSQELLFVSGSFLSFSGSFLSFQWVIFVISLGLFDARTFKKLI